MKTVLYRHFTADGKLLYVGISDFPLQRNAGHKACSPWFGQIARVEFEWIDSYRDAQKAERAAILAEKPLYNVPSKHQEWLSREYSGALGLLVSWMRDHGYCQTDVARAIGSSHPTVSGWINRNRRPTASLAARVEALTSGAVPASSWEAR